MTDSGLDKEIKVRISEAMHSELQRHAEIGRRTKYPRYNVSDVVRDAIEEYLKARDSKKAKAERVKAKSDAAL